jgi:hypothetical protein
MSSGLCTANSVEQLRDLRKNEGEVKKKGEACKKHVLCHA